MLEVIVAAYVFSFLLSTAMVIWNYFAVKARLSSGRLQILNQNLQKIGLYWVSNQSSFAPYSSEAFEKDRESLLRSAMFLEGLALFSVAGLIILIIVVLSSRYFAVSRLERAVFHSFLAIDPSLSPVQVNTLVEELKLIR